MTEQTGMRIALALESLRPGHTSEPVTPSDEDELEPIDELFCGGAGTVYGLLRGDTGTKAEARPYPVTAGTRLPYDFRLIFTNTSASGLVAIRSRGRR